MYCDVYIGMAMGLVCVGLPACICLCLTCMYACAHVVSLEAYGGVAHTLLRPGLQQKCQWRFLARALG